MLLRWLPRVGCGGALPVPVTAAGHGGACCRFRRGDSACRPGDDGGGLAPAVQQRRRLSDQIGRATSELQSQSNLVCRLLLEKKNNKYQLSQECRNDTHA